MYYDSDWAYWDGYDAYYAYEHRTYDNPFDSWYEFEEYAAWKLGWDAARQNEYKVYDYGRVYYW